MWYPGKTIFLLNSIWLPFTHTYTHTHTHTHTHVKGKCCVSEAAAFSSLQTYLISHRLAGPCTLTATRRCMPGTLILNHAWHQTCVWDQQGIQHQSSLLFGDNKLTDHFSAISVCFPYEFLCGFDLETSTVSNGRTKLTLSNLGWWPSTFCHLALPQWRKMYRFQCRKELEIAFSSCTYQ